MIDDLPLFRASSRGCQWVDGEGADRRQCCKATVNRTYRRDKSSWCAEHYARVYRIGTALPPGGVDRIARRFSRFDKQVAYTNPE